MSRHTEKRQDRVKSQLLNAVSIFILTVGLLLTSMPMPSYAAEPSISAPPVTILDIPEYSGAAYTIINDNVPYFTEEDLILSPYEFYSNLDYLGRCGFCAANVGEELMPTEERGDIGPVKPTGWQTVKYNGLVNGNYLYNRCHLIGYQLTGENANEQNLITGTRYMNEDGMCPFENMVADYIKETGNHVLYRVTPLFDGNNLVASAVLMEAESVEDSGDGVLYNVFCYNVQPGISIDYSDGSSWLNETGSEDMAEASATQNPDIAQNAADSYVVNGNNGKIHINGGCPATGDGENAMKHPVYFDTYEEAEVYSIQIDPGLDKRKCGNCW